jgi:hypothetical protein
MVDGWMQMIKVPKEEQGHPAEQIEVGVCRHCRVILRYSHDNAPYHAGNDEQYGSREAEGVSNLV